MFSSTLLIAATAVIGLVNAQNYSTSGPLTIDVNQVPLELRNSWCVAERSTCPAICGGSAFPNECFADSLEYECKCTDGPTPNITDYRNTIPAYVCAQWKINCVANHPDDLIGQQGCHSVKCGQKNATTGTSSGSSSAAASATGSGSGGSGAASASASSSSSGSSSSSSEGAAAMNVAQSYGTSIIAAGMLALFGLAL